MAQTLIASCYIFLAVLIIWYSINLVIKGARLFQHQLELASQNSTVTLHQGEDIELIRRLASQKYKDIAVPALRHWAQKINITVYLVIFAAILITIALYYLLHKSTGLHSLLGTDEYSSFIVMIVGCVVLGLTLIVSTTHDDTLDTCSPKQVSNKLLLKGVLTIAFGLMGTICIILSLKWDLAGLLIAIGGVLINIFDLVVRQEDAQTQIRGFLMLLMGMIIAISQLLIR